MTCSELVSFALTLGWFPDWWCHPCCKFIGVWGLSSSLSLSLFVFFTLCVTKEGEDFTFSIPSATLRRGGTKADMARAWSVARPVRYKISIWVGGPIVCRLSIVCGIPHERRRFSHARLCTASGAGELISTVEERWKRNMSAFEKMSALENKNLITLLVFIYFFCLFFVFCFLLLQRDYLKIHVI